MKTERLLIVVLPVMLGIVSCEVPYDIPVAQLSNDYVVDGFISDTPGPYTIKLTYSAAYSSGPEGLNASVTDAQVSIIDSTDNNKTTYLNYVNSGKYATQDDFRGIVGHRYSLHVVTKDGNELVSDAEELPPCTNDIQGHYEYVDATAFHPQGDRVWLTIKDIPGEKDYYRWEYDGVYQFATHLRYYPFSSTCWQYEYFYFDILLATDQYFDGRTFDKDITVIEYRSGAPYLVTVKTESLTERAFNFWKQIDDQVNNSSGIFGKLPAHIKGNMYCLNDPGINVLGYFGASSVKKTFVFMKRDDQGPIDNPIFYPDNVDCITYPDTKRLSGDPNDYPEGWQ